MDDRSTIISALLLTSLGAPAPATHTVEVNHAKSSVSPTLYGLMTEEINYSYDGGLYAELIRNRTFRSDWSGVLNWYLVEKGAASAKLSVDDKTGPSAALRTSAKLEVTRANPDSRAVLLNEGYWGIAVRPNRRYATQEIECVARVQANGIISTVAGNGVSGYPGGSGLARVLNCGLRNKRRLYKGFHDVRHAITAKN